MKFNRIGGVVAAAMALALLGAMGCKKEEKPLPRIKSIKILQEKPKPGDKLEASVDAFDPAAEPADLEYRWSVDGAVKAGAAAKDFDTKGLPEKSQVLVEARAKGKETGRTGEWSKSLPVVLIKPIPTLAGVLIKPAEAYTMTPLEVEVEFGEIDPAATLYYQWNIVRNEGGKTIKGKLKATGDKLEGGSLRRNDKIQVLVSSEPDFKEPHVKRSNLVNILNSPPHFTNCELNQTKTGVKIVCDARDDDGDALTFYNVEAPASAKISNVKGKGVLSIGYDDTKPGNYRIKIGVKDEFGGKDVYDIPTPVEVRGEGGRR